MLNMIKNLFSNQCEKVVKQIIEDNSNVETAYSTMNFVSKIVNSGYEWSKGCIYKCHEKLLGTKQTICKYHDAYRRHNKLIFRKKQLGKKTLII